MGFSFISRGLFASFVILCLQAGFVDSFLLGAGNADWPELEDIQRSRREANKTENQQPDANTACVIRNLKDIEEKLEQALPPEKSVNKAAALAKPHQIFSNADPATLEKFCTIYKASRFRLAACGDSQMKTFAAKALAVVDFVCIDRYDEFVGAFPCIQKVDRLMDAECQTNCSAYESAAEKLSSAGALIVKKYGPNEIKELFAQSCLYVSCFMNCQKPILEAKCGEKVLMLEMTSIGVTFRNLDDMMSQSAASNVWPRECKPLSSMGVGHESKATQAVTVLSSVNSTSLHLNQTSANSSIVEAPRAASLHTSTTTSPNSTSTASTIGGIVQTKVTTSSPAVANIAPASNTTTTTTVLPIPTKAASLPPGVGTATARARLLQVRKN